MDSSCELNYVGHDQLDSDEASGSESKLFSKGKEGIQLNGVFIRMNTVGVKKMNQYLHLFYDQYFHILAKYGSWVICLAPSTQCAQVNRSSTTTL